MQYIYWKIVAFFKRHGLALALTGLAALFFLGTASFNYLAHNDSFDKWLSPDESANYFMAGHYGTSGSLWFMEELNPVADGIIRPRSLRSDGAVTKPVSFLGIMLIYGKLGALFGTDSIQYLTPFFAGLGVIVFFLLVRRLFSDRIALVAAALLAGFPVWIYFSARSMFHNVLFMTLVLLFLYCSSLMLRAPGFSARAVGTASLSGLFFGLAVITRTSELLWLLPLLLFGLIFYFKKLSLLKAAMFLFFALVAVLPVFYWNQVLYDSPIKSGYPEMDQSIANITKSSGQAVKSAMETDIGSTATWLENLWNSIFVFGFQPDHSAKMFYYYAVRMFPWLVFGAFLGMMLLPWSRQKSPKNSVFFLIGWVGVSLVVVFYYGSWVFYDNPDPSSHTIGNSYTRYWLPFYLGALPLLALIIVRLSDLFKQKSIRNLSTVLVVLVIAVFNIYGVVFKSEESLSANLERLGLAEKEYGRVMRLTEADSIIITLYHDKTFFPERRVIVGLLTDQAMNLRYARLAKFAPVYYYNFTFSSDDIEYLNSRKLLEVGMQIETVDEVTPDFTLYRLNLINN